MSTCIIIIIMVAFMGGHVRPILYLIGHYLLSILCIIQLLRDISFNTFTRLSLILKSLFTWLACMKSDTE